MHLSLRPLLLATGALLFSAQHASAQFIELVTESAVTITGSITTTATTATATERKTVQTVTALKHNDVLADIVASLRTAGSIAPDAPTTGWSLVSVNYAPADLKYVDAGGHLYAVNGSLRVLVPSEKFSIDGHLSRSAAKYKEKHLGRYFLSSSGTITNHVSYDYLAKLNVGGTSYSLTDSRTDGFATINFASKDEADGFEVFFFAISSLRASARGSFTATTVPASGSQGLISLNFVTGPAKLVPASNYPEAETFPGLSL